MLANNETGVLFPIEEVGRIVKENSNALFHVDGVQAVGKIPIDLKSSDVDLFALSGHKFHAPQGVGALYIRNGVVLPSFIIGGGQESGRRAGTSAVANIVALGAAAELAGAGLNPGDEGGLTQPEDHHQRIRRLRDKLEDVILDTIPNARLNGARDRSKRLPNTANISFEFIEGESITAHLDNDGICVSTGSACHSSSHVSSPTLRAMDIPYTRAMGSIRFSLGRYNTDEEIDYVLERLTLIVDRLVAMSPYSKELAGLQNR
jgi:cysteine desulfurase